MTNKTSGPAIALTVVLGAAPAALAQENPFSRDRFTAVQDRYQPDFDQEPARLGAFNLRSSLGLGVQQNDNIYGLGQNVIEDTILTVTPELNLTSGWTQHLLAAGVRTDVKEYQDNGDESVTDHQAFLTGRYDISPRFSVGGRLEGGQFSEQRYAPASVSNAAEPTRYDRFTSEAFSTWRSDRVQVEGGFGLIRDSYDDVPAIVAAAVAPRPVIDQDFRDQEESFVRGRLSYAVSPDVAVFIQGRASDIDFGKSNRDAERRTAQVGLSFELSSPWRGDIAVGYTEEKKKAAALQSASFDGLSVDGRLQWFPTELTTVTFNANRYAFDPGLLVGSSAAFTGGSVRIDHELRRNVVLFGEGRLSSVEFQDVDRTDDTNEFSVGVGYKFNKRVRLDASYTFRNFDSSGRDGDREAISPTSSIPRSFDQNILGLNLRLFP
jgi:hypothetical protein